jgi:hypothetical protein
VLVFTETVDVAPIACESIAIILRDVFVCGIRVLSKR